MSPRACAGWPSHSGDIHPSRRGPRVQAPRFGQYHAPDSAGDRLYSPHKRPAYGHSSGITLLGRPTAPHDSRQHRLLSELEKNWALSPLNTWFFSKTEKPCVRARARGFEQGSRCRPQANVRVPRKQRRAVKPAHLLMPGFEVFPVSAKSL